MRIRKALEQSILVKEKILQDIALLRSVDQVIELCIQAFQKEHQVLFCGNGGSAADAQHLAAEFSGRFYFDRPPLNAEALHVNTSYLTAVANDYSYDEVFSRLVRAKGKAGDILFSLTTSGNSPNVLRAMETARDLNMTNIVFTGESGGKAKALADVLINVPSSDTPHIQESHMAIGHVVCEEVERRMFGKS
jgi:D-sedoheptulose 7-phosphate isomerase